MSEALFDLEEVKMDSPRMKEIRYWDVQTSYAEQCAEEPWIAVPMVLARKALGMDKDDEVDLDDLTASDARTLEDQGLICGGGSEEEVQDEALAVCYERGGES
jgi:hypothetical protein